MNLVYVFFLFSFSVSFFLTSEIAARRRFETKAEEGAKILSEKEAAVRRVDQLTVRAKAQEDSYDALVRRKLPYRRIIGA